MEPTRPPSAKFIPITRDPHLLHFQRRLTYKGWKEKEVRRGEDQLPGRARSQPSFPQNLWSLSVLRESYTKRVSDPTSSGREHWPRTDGSSARPAPTAQVIVVTPKLGQPASNPPRARGVIQREANVLAVACTSLPRPHFPSLPSPHLTCSCHRGLLAVPQTCEELSCLGPFAWTLLSGKLLLRFVLPCPRPTSFGATPCKVFPILNTTPLLPHPSPSCFPSLSPPDASHVYLLSVASHGT